MEIQQRGSKMTFGKNTPETSPEKSIKSHEPESIQSYFGSSPKLIHDEKEMELSSNSS